MDQRLDFLQIHNLAEKFRYGAVYLQDERTAMALTALGIMDKYKTLHCAEYDFSSFLYEINDANHLKYSQQWSSEVRAQVVVPEYLFENEISATPEKDVLLKEFVAIFQQKFIDGDFKSISTYVTRLSTMAQFSNHVTSLEAFVKNRYFEYMFYQIVSLVCGLLWGLTSLHSSSVPSDGAVNEGLELLEKKLLHYHSRSAFLLKNLNEQHPQIIEDVSTELEFYTLCRWFLAMTMFKKGQLVAFSLEFACLYSTLGSISKLNMQLEVLAMYAVASMECKPFKELTLRQNESLVELYIDGCGVESLLYKVMLALANAEFAHAKRLMDAKFFEAVDSVLLHKLPKRNQRFWLEFVDVLDLKAFLLILSVTRRISRQKMVEKIGYLSCTPSEFSNVSNKLIVLMSVLQLGKINITYDSTSDLFVREALDENRRQQHLLQQFAQISHYTRAEGAAQLLRGMLVEKYF